MLSPKKRVNISTTKLTHLNMNLIDSHLKSYAWLIEEGIQELFDEINPISDYSGESWELSFKDLRLDKPNCSFEDALKFGKSYEAPLYVTVQLKNIKSSEIKEQELYFIDLPLISDRGTFVVNGNERVLVMQIVRSEGVLFTEGKNSTSTKPLYSVKLIPQRGRWFDFEVSKQNVLSVRLLEKRPKILITTLLKAFGYSEENIIELLGEFDTGEVKFLETTLKKDHTKSREEALVEVFTKLKPEDSVTLEAARTLINNIFFNARVTWLGRTGRYKLNKKLGLTSAIEKKNYVFYKEDVVAIVKALIQLNNGKLLPDDIDHLANRRIKGPGELMQERLRAGILRMEKNIKDKMSTFSSDELITPSVLVNTRPVSSAILQFFGSSAVSRYMDQENVLSEVESKRKITAGGPGGLTKESATFSVRDVHFSQYSRICPVTTPEGPMIGIVSHMSLYSRVNDYGFLEAPYRKVVNTIKIKDTKESELVNRIADESVSELGLKKETVIDEKMAKKILSSKLETIKVVPYITSEIDYIEPDDEVKFVIGQANIGIDEHQNIIEKTSFIRTKGIYANLDVSLIQYVDVNPAQIAGLGFSLIPFGANDDSNRTLMGSNMQRQAVPLIKPEAPIVGTGYEAIAARASARAVYAEADGDVEAYDGSRLKVIYEKDKEHKKEWEKAYDVQKFFGTNQNTCFNQEVLVKPDHKFKKGDLLVDGPCMQNGELALGTNLVAAYMAWDGYNFDDGIIVSEKLVKEDMLSSIHIKEYVQDIRETKLGPEEITRDIPSAGDYALRNLDEVGVVRVGASVTSGDILIGIIAPKGETELSAEEKLLRAIFGEASKDVRDNSLRLPHGDKGVVINVQVLDKNKGDKLSPGVLKQVKVFVARTHKIGVGDKLTGRHGDKGVIAKVLPVEDMPYLADGTPVDIVLSPLSIVKRMNLGQLKEAHLGMSAKMAGVNVAVAPFAPVDENIIFELAKKEGYDNAKKVQLFDGRTGQPFDHEIVVGIRYILKLNHLADDKVHARSTGPYTMVTQQPLGGKAQFGGQRFGEMEVWALEAHAVPNVLHEMLTIKSDDVVGRALAYKSIIQGKPIEPPNIPESFKVLTAELRSLGLNLDTVGAIVVNKDLEAEVEEGVVSGETEKEEVVITEEDTSENSEMEIKESIIDLDK
ncbi:MAG: DNA-directed RNA polymerase subunit beta [bacterium]